MNRILTTLSALAFIPCILFADEKQQTAMDRLIEDYQTTQRSMEPENTKAEITRLRSQLIDVRVERDQLSNQVIFLKTKIENIETSEAHANPICHKVKCIPITEIENDKIITHVIYSLNQYRLAELITQTIPLKDGEVHKKAQRIMIGEKNDLNMLGFDTTDMKRYPILDELIEQWIISQRSRIAE